MKVFLLLSLLVVSALCSVGITELESTEIAVGEAHNSGSKSIPPHNMYSLLLPFDFSAKEKLRWKITVTSGPSVRFYVFDDSSYSSCLNGYLCIGCESSTGKSWEDSVEVDTGCPLMDSSSRVRVTIYNYDQYQYANIQYDFWWGVGWTPGDWIGTLVWLFICCGCCITCICACARGSGSKKKKGHKKVHIRKQTGYQPIGGGPQATQQGPPPPNQYQQQYQPAMQPQYQQPVPQAQYQPQPVDGYANPVYGNPETSI